MSNSFNISEAIIDTNGELATLSAPVINDSGTIAFSGTTDDGDRGIYSFDDTLITVVRNSELEEFTTLADNLSLNNNDALLYRTSTSFPPLGVGNTDLILDRDGTTTTLNSLRRERLRSKDYRDVRLNDSNNAVALTVLITPEVTVEEIIFIDAGGTSEVIATSVIGANPIGFADIGDIAINNQNTIAYSATSGDFSNGFTTSVYTTSDRVIPIEDDRVGDIAINDSEVIVFSSNSTNGENREQLQQISASNEVTSLSNTDGLFNDFESISLNNQGNIVFEAILDDGTKGIFAGVDPVGDRIIAVGDSLSGSQVADLEFSSEGLNNSGTISFQAELANGTIGIYQATSNHDEVNIIDGTEKKDNLLGTANDDIISGGDGKDTLSGGAGNDTLYGENGKDVIFGEAGNDFLSGGNGKDTLNGGADNDTIEGGSGKDLFVLAAGAGTDVITDFGNGSDVIELSNGLTYSDLSFEGSEIIFESETLATLTGVDATKLTESNFTVALVY